MKIVLCCVAALAAAQYDIPPTCSSEVSSAFYRCTNFLNAHDPFQGVEFLKNPDTHLAICYGDLPACNDIQSLALTSAGACSISYIKGYLYIVPKDAITPCPDPLPPRVGEIQLCTANRLTLSEYYSQLYTDVVRNNINEKFSYNRTSKTLIAKSNGQCLQAVPNQPPLTGYGTLKTAPCDSAIQWQKWNLDNYRVSNPYSGACLKTDPSQRGSVVAVEQCDSGNPVLSKQFFSDCTTTNYVRIVTTRGKRVSEYYTGLYFNTPTNNFNELFTWDANTQMFKSASNQQCLDSFLDNDGKYKIHTYNCDANNGNQKWIVHTDTKQIEHATHKGQCLDGDPTYGDHHLQMWACVPNNENQQWNIEEYTG
ncbi:hypothetical protein THRCLA_05729 [Thraustotheca clavata]|uniref:Ricin B lectin domain-containing protein n=1 Tax=Thraustotheca clavata TaxID=74557 RepID=A0A1V9ZV32_9STRA|nr:hypothetical protein THRCLA_05729 [Thraustotheca clavata]